jgi:alcohol dehydrogenase (cytochrome c)
VRRVHIIGAIVAVVMIGWMDAGLFRLKAEATHSTSLGPFALMRKGEATVSSTLVASAFRRKGPQSNDSDGRRLFETNCATCHGSDGQGSERGPDLVLSRRALARPLEDLQRLIKAGIPAGGMPPSALSDPDIAAVARHLRSLAEAARQPRTFPRVRARLRDGRTLEGLVQSEGPFDLQLLTSEGRLAALVRDEVSALEDIGRGVMPDLKPRDASEPPRPGDWPTYNGTPDGNRHTRLNQITPANVGNLRVKWVFGAGAARNLSTTPLVVDGVMYLTGPNEVFALDARSGRQIWHYSRPRTRGVIGDASAGVHRGVAVRGDRLYTVTDDARLLALHRANGQLLWDVTMADFRDHYGATTAPLVVNNLVISGISGGDEGIRGFLAAFDAVTGKEIWRFWTVPAPGAPGSETWKGRAIEHGCAATWLTGSYDAATNLLFWTTGNPCPDYNGSERIGDNLWSNSVLALDPASGALRWFYQFTPHDLNDWDAVQTVILADTEFGGRRRRLLLQANRNGFFYVLDRETGALLLAQPFITKLNWATGIGADGRPLRIAGMEPSVRGTMTCPSVVGATNWMSPAFNPDTGLFYVMALERCSVFQKSAVWFERGQSFYGGSTQNVPGESGRKYLRAIDIQSGKIAWEVPQIGQSNSWGGVLSTATGLVFFADDSGAFAAADARSGKRLWHLPVNAMWKASPMTYTVGDQQFVAIAGGGNVFAFGL